MQNLKLSEWANVAEIIASIVIVASLVYVGLEVNQNTRALQNDSYQNILALSQEQQNTLATDKEFHRIFLTGENSPSELSEEEWSRFTQFMFPRIGLWEYLYLSKQDNSISPSVWMAFDPYFRDVICMKGYRRFVEENRVAHAPIFMEYLETDVFPDCGSQ